MDPNFLKVRTESMSDMGNRPGGAYDSRNSDDTHTHTQSLLWPQSMGTTILPKYGPAKKTVLTPHDTDTHHTLFQFPLPAELSRRLGLVDILRLCVGGQPLLFSLKARTPDLKILKRSGGAEKLSYST